MLSVLPSFPLPLSKTMLGHINQVSLPRDWAPYGYDGCTVTQKIGPANKMQIKHTSN